MHSIWIRLNTVVFFGLSTLLVMTVSMALSTYLHTPRPVIRELKLNSLRSLRSLGRYERASMTVDVDLGTFYLLSGISDANSKPFLSVDLASEFNWNTKIIFAFIYAEYRTQHPNVLNQVVIWDNIMRSAEDATIEFTDLLNKYELADPYGDLRGRDVELKLRYETMPIAGRLFLKDLPTNLSTTFTMPTRYVKADTRRNPRDRSRG